MPCAADNPPPKRCMERGVIGASATVGGRKGCGAGSDTDGEAWELVGLAAHAAKWIIDWQTSDEIW